METEYSVMDDPKSSYSYIERIHAVLHRGGMTHDEMLKEIIDIVLSA